METNRHHAMQGAIEDQVLAGFGENDSIIDRLLAMPAPLQGEDDGVRAWDAAVTRRMEKLIADRIRKRIGDRKVV